MDKMPMNERLKLARKSANYESADAAARAMGVPAPTYHGHENGSRGFMHEAPRYADFYRVDLKWLMTGRGTPPPAPQNEQKKPEVVPRLGKELDTSHAQANGADEEVALTHEDRILLKNYHDIDESLRAKFFKDLMILGEQAREAKSNFRKRSSK